MATPRRPQMHGVLPVGVAPGVLDRLAGRLERADVRLLAPVDNWAIALRLIASEPYQGLLVAYPLPGVSMSEFLEGVRRPDSASREAALVLLAPRRFQAEASVYLGRGANRVVTLEDSVDALPRALERLFQVAPRFSVKVPGRVEVRERGLARRLFCQTVNISMTGMLLRLPHSYRPGTDLGFELMFPGSSEPLCGSARVVRATLERREPFPGVGVAFSAFQLGQQARLAALLHSFSPPSRGQFAEH